MQAIPRFPPAPPILKLGDSIASILGPYDATAAMARMSQRIYGTYAEIIDAVASLGGSSAVLFENGSTRAAGFILDGHACVAFRGTATARDWWTDAKFFWTGTPRRHVGFVRAWERIEKEVIAWLTIQQAAGRRMVFAGHSLGAALAILAAFECAPRFDVAAVITFGSPRVGSLAFRRAYQSHPSSRAANAPALGRITWRFVEGGDAITIMPPPLMYFHVGRAAGLKPFTPANPLALVIQDETAGDAWLRRIENAQAAWKTFPPEPLNRKNIIKMVTILLGAIGFFVPPVSDQFAANHWWLTLAIRLLLTIPGLMIVRLFVLSFLDHPSNNYCRTFSVRHD